jgi:hypothetical protein
MPLPSTQRPALTSFLPQFAASSEDQISPGMIPDGEHGDALAAAHASRTNGHSATFDAEEIVNRSEEHSLVLAGSQNGTADHSLFDASDASASVVVNGNGSGYLNGTAIDSSLNRAVGEVLASSAASRSNSAEINGAAEIEIGQPLLPPAPAVQSPNQAEASHQPQQAGSRPESTPLSEHPAAGSCFAPYLVTEIRELRNRCKRRSWWRRLFG